MEEEKPFIFAGFGLPTRSCLFCFHMMTFSWQKGVGKNTSRWSYVTKSAAPKLIKKSLLESSIQFLINYKELYGALRDTYSASPLCLLMSWRKEIIWLKSPFVICHYPKGLRWLTRYPKPRVGKLKGDKFASQTKRIALFTRKQID